MDHDRIAEGWWQASDGRWYPPDQRPDLSSFPAPPTQVREASQPALTHPSYRPRQQESDPFTATGCMWSVVYYWTAFSLSAIVMGLLFDQHQIDQDAAQHPKWWVAVACTLVGTLVLAKVLRRLTASDVAPLRIPAKVLVWFFGLMLIVSVIFATLGLILLRDGFRVFVVGMLLFGRR